MMQCTFEKLLEKYNPRSLVGKPLAGMAWSGQRGLCRVVDRRCRMDGWNYFDRRHWALKSKRING
jgi:hypothetical protein